VLVARDASGGFSGATFYIPQPAMEKDRADAIAKAVAWIDEHGMISAWSEHLAPPRRYSLTS
jgi:hypothetical protein